MSQSGVYSESKLTWWYSREQGLPEAPKQVQVIISDLCNQDCKFCAYRMSGYSSNQLFIGESKPALFGHNNPLRQMDTDRCLRLLDEIHRAGCLSVQFTGGGEPTAHKHHQKIFQHALDLGLRCSLVSNGIAWRDDLIYSVLHKFDWVRVSIDAANARSYSETRRCPQLHFTAAWEHVTQLADSIRSQRSPCVLGVGFVVTPDSYQEIPAFAKMAKRVRVHNVRYTAMFSTEDEEPFIPIYDEVRWLIQQARSENEDDKFKVYDNFGSRFDDLRQHAPDYSICSYQHYTTYVGGDMQAYRCCVLAYNERGKVQGGDLTERPFDEFWASQERQDDMVALDARGCERCQFNSKNRGLLYVMGDTKHDKESRHLEWP